MNDLRRRLKRIPLALLFALAVAVGASVVMVVQIYVVPPPSAIVAPIDTTPSAVTEGTYTVTFSISLYYGQRAVYDNLAALGLVSLQASTDGWSYLVNDWIYTVVRRDTGSTSFTLPTGVTVDVYEYNSTHALVVNTQRNTVVITKKVSVGTTGWYAYHPVVADYDTTTLNALTGYMDSKGLTQLYVFQPRHDYIVFDSSANEFRVYFDVVTSSAVTVKGYYMSDTSGLVALSPGSAVVPTDTQYIINTNNVVLAPVWVTFTYMPTSDMTSTLTVTPQLPPNPPNPAP
jgi:hypothetical protein